MVVVGLALLAAFDPLPRSLADQGDQGAYSLGFRAGVAHVPDPDDSTWTAGLAFRGGLGSVLAYEVAASYHPTDLEEGRIDEEVFAAQGSLLVYPFPGAALRPYALAGVGALFVDTTFKAPDPGDEDDVLFGGQAGAGLDVDLGRGAYLSADARWNFYGASDHLESEDLDFLQVTIGLHFRFS